MRLRWKLMALLAAFGLLPTLVVGLYGRAALVALGDGLAESGRATTVGRLRAEMGDTIAQAAVLLDHRRVTLEMALRAQAAEVARRLERSPPTPGEAGLERSLADLPAALDRLDAALDGGILRHFVITADGRRFVWPADGPAAPVRDPRNLPWYADALDTGGPAWTAPHRDRATGHLVLTAGMAVADAAGEVIAATGLHVSVLAGAHVLQAFARPPDGTTGLLVIPHPPRRRDETTAPTLRILAVGRFPTGPDSEWAPPEEDGRAAPALPETDPAFRTMVDALAAGGAGTTRLEWRGRPALWAYGALPGNGTGVIYVVPFDRLDAIAAGVAAVVQKATNGQLMATGGAVLAIFTLAVAGAWVGARQVVEPLHGLGRAMERVAAGDLSARAPVASRDEVGEAARRFNAMVPLLEDRLGLRRDLGLAQDVQQALLPAGAPAVDGFDLAGASLYSDETGGDYYDFVSLAPPGRWAVLVGDVTGHGISAALLMTTIRAMLRARARTPDGTDPATLLQSVNPLLADDVSGGRFMTVFCLFLNAGQPDVQWSSAGHGGCFLFDPASGVLEPLEGDDIPLGIDGAWTFAVSRRLRLAPGHILALGTDGLLEARDAEGREFGAEGLAAALSDAVAGHAGAPTAAAVRDAVLAACAAHRGDRPPRDDTTLVVVRRI
jgi:sigma-B regulation protein RsbU (phosphoserine phosphatase)